MIELPDTHTVIHIFLFLFYGGTKQIFTHQTQLRIYCLFNFNSKGQKPKKGRKQRRNKKQFIFNANHRLLKFYANHQTQTYNIYWVPKANDK